MEIRTEPVGFGEYLLAPQRNASGREEWSYTLTSYVQPGDESFTGTTARVMSRRSSGGLKQLAHSKRSNGRGKHAAHVAARVVARRLDRRGGCRSRTLSNLISQSREPCWSAVVPRSSRHSTRLRRAVVGTLYGPFQNRSDGLRAAQGYLTKFPAALVDLLFSTPARSSITPAERRGTPRTGRGQGYESNAQKRSASNVTLSMPRSNTTDKRVRAASKNAESRSIYSCSLTGLSDTSRSKAVSASLSNPCNSRRAKSITRVGISRRIFLSWMKSRRRSRQTAL